MTDKHYMVMIHDLDLDWESDDGSELSTAEKRRIKDTVTKTTLEVPVYSDSVDLENAIADVISDKTGFCVKDFEYNICGMWGDILE